MLAKTHVVGGVVAGLGMATYANTDPVIVVIAAACGSLIPDIDHAKSTITRSNPLFRLLSAMINLLFTHRTFTHSLVFVGLVAWGLSYVPLMEAAKIGLIAGIISHLLLDAATTQGIKLFYPMKTRFRFPLTVRTGGMGENAVLGFLVLLGAYLLYIGM